MNIFEIIKAWKIAHNPTDRQLKLAKERGSICKLCPYIGKQLTISICIECGCPIRKKIFSDVYNSCPKQKWAECDSSYFNKPYKQ